MKRAVENNRKRIDEIDVLIERIYEDNVKGKLTDERFLTMSRKLEEEQRLLKTETEAVQSELAKGCTSSRTKRKANAISCSYGLRQCTSIS